MLVEIELSVSHVYRGRCDSWNIFGVMTYWIEKRFNEIDTNFEVITARYSHKQFSTCSELLISIDKELDQKIFLHECSNKLSVNGGLGYKTGFPGNQCLSHQGNSLCNSKSNSSLACSNKVITRCWENIDFDQIVHVKCFSHTHKTSYIWSCLFNLWSSMIKIWESNLVFDKLQGNLWMFNISKQCRCGFLSN